MSRTPNISRSFQLFACSYHCSEIKATVSFLNFFMEVSCPRGFQYLQLTHLTTNENVLLARQTNVHVTSSRTEAAFVCFVNSFPRWISFFSIKLTSSLYDTKVVSIKVFPYRSFLCVFVRPRNGFFYWCVESKLLTFFQVLVCTPHQKFARASHPPSRENQPVNHPLCSDEGLTLETSANTLFTAFSISTSTLRWYVVPPRRRRPKLVLTGPSIPLNHSKNQCESTDLIGCVAYLTCKTRAGLCVLHLTTYRARNVRVTLRNAALFRVCGEVDKCNTNADMLRTGCNVNPVCCGG